MKPMWPQTVLKDAIEQLPEEGLSSFTASDL